MRLTKGQVVRCSNSGNTGVMGKVILASEGDPQSVLVGLNEVKGLRDNRNGMMVCDSLALIINYESETVIDLCGNEWEIDVREGES